MRFCVESITKYNPIVTAPAITRLKTINSANMIVMLYTLVVATRCQFQFIPKKNLAPNLWTHSGSQKLVGIHARPIIIV